MSPSTVAEWGGVFAVLAFAHFVVDWVFQTHWEAMNKTQRWPVHFYHCTMYSAGVTLVAALLGLVGWPSAAAFAILFISHFVEDTYVPVFLWAKYVRRIPKLRQGTKKQQFEAFKRMFNEPLGTVLFIAIDQIIHLTFLWPVVWLLVR